MTDRDLANLSRDRVLRRSILKQLYESRATRSPLGGIGAKTVRNVLENAYLGDQGVEDDDHAMRLFVDLRDSGYCEMADLRVRKSQRYGIDVVFLKITDKGSRLVREEIPVDPSIDDERIG